MSKCAYFVFHVKSAYGRADVECPLWATGHEETAQNLRDALTIHFPQDVVSGKWEHRRYVVREGSSVTDGTAIALEDRIHAIEQVLSRDPNRHVIGIANRCSIPLWDCERTLFCLRMQDRLWSKWAADASAAGSKAVAEESQFAESPACPNVAIHATNADSLAPPAGDDAGEDAAGEAGERTSVTKLKPPAELNSTDEAAADFIRQNPGCKGDAVAIAACVEPEHFRSRIMPKLRTHGFYNKRGKGYYAPPT